MTIALHAMPACLHFTPVRHVRAHKRFEYAPVERQHALESVRRTLHLAWHLALRHLLEQQIRYNGVCLEAACGLRTSQVRGAFIKYTP